MNTLRNRLGGLRSVITCAAASASLLSACAPLLTTDVTLGPNDTAARVRFRFVGNGALSVLQYAEATCHAESDPAVRSLVSITYQAHTLNLAALPFSPPKLGMPGKPEDVSDLTYGEVVVKAGEPLVFGPQWSTSDGIRYYRAWRFASFTPDSGADYEVVIGDGFKQPMTLSVVRLQVVDGHVDRVPVTAATLKQCGST